MKPRGRYRGPVRRMFGLEVGKWYHIGKVVYPPRRPIMYINGKRRKVKEAVPC